MNEVAMKKYTKESRELLAVASSLPDNPCDYCSVNGNTSRCAGCVAEQNYRKAWKPYEDADIDGEARMLVKRRVLMKSIELAEQEIEAINSGLPDFVGGQIRTGGDSIGSLLAGAAGTDS